MKDLVQIIRDNPGCRAEIDNDYWTLYKALPKPFAEMTKEEIDDYFRNGELISSIDKFEPLGSGGYGSGNEYGGDILQALAKIVGITIESV
jgi:hypothetical protein